MSITGLSVASDMQFVSRSVAENILLTNNCVVSKPNFLYNIQNFVCKMFYF